MSQTQDDDVIVPVLPDQDIEAPLPEVIPEEALPEPETPEVVEVIQEAPSAPLPPVLSESEQIVAVQSELDVLLEKIAKSRSEFAVQTDVQNTTVIQLEGKIASLQEKKAGLEKYIEEIYPSEREKFIKIQTEATTSMERSISRAQQLDRKEQELVRREESASLKESENDSTEKSLAILSVTLNEREKELKKRGTQGFNIWSLTPADLAALKEALNKI